MGEQQPIVAGGVGRRHVAVRVDCSPTMGVGHLLRCLALAEELVGRGHRVTLVGSTHEMAWPARQVQQRQLIMVPAADHGQEGHGAGVALVDQLRGLGVDALVLDGYELPNNLGAAAREAAVPVMTMVDGCYGLHQQADLYVDQNLGARAADGLPSGAVMLAGLEHAVLRDQVLDRRGQYRPVAVPARPRVLVVFGGTDPYGGTEIVVDLLRSLQRPLTIVAVTPRPEVAAALRGPTTGEVGLEVHGTVDDLPGLAVGCDAAVSAAGTSVWELLCLGVPTGLVCVADNQRTGYRETVRAAVVAPVGELEQLREPSRSAGAGAGESGARRALDSLLGDGPSRLRWHERGRALVDGGGRARVADALLRLVNGAVRSESASARSEG